MVRPTLPFVQAALALAALAGCTLRPAGVPLPTATLPPSETPLPRTATPTITPLPSATSPPTPSAAPLPTPDGAITRGPYLQSATSDSIVIVWETDRVMPGEVIYGREGLYDQQVVSAADGVRHEVMLGGLEAATTYAYWIASNGYPVSEPARFRTAPVPGPAPFTFIAYGDTRSGDEVHRQVADSILARMPDFTVHTGDLVLNGIYDSQWDNFFEIERRLLANVPLFPSPGNHEADSQRYYDAFVLPGNERWYAFDWGNARILCLQIDAIAPFGTQSEQVQWLESALAANTQEWLIVVFHIPPYDAVFENEMAYAARVNLVPLFERYGVDLVINGHSHNYQRSVVNGITYIVTAGGGAELYYVDQPELDTRAYYNGHHFTQFTLQGGWLTGKALTPDGTVVDAFSLESGGPAG